MKRSQALIRCIGTKRKTNERNVNEWAQSSQPTKQPNDRTQREKSIPTTEKFQSITENGLLWYAFQMNYVQHSMRCTNTVRFLRFFNICIATEQERDTHSQRWRRETKRIKSKQANGVCALLIFNSHTHTDTHRVKICMTKQTKWGKQNERIICGSARERSCVVVWEVVLRA